MASHPTGTASDNLLVLGDLNAYANEDPITELEGQGYVDLNELHSGSNAWADGAQSYVFDGELGTLDYGMANASLVAQVTGAEAWHINADEPFVLDYQNFNPPDQITLDEFKSSDHDPIVVGIALEGAAGPTCDGLEPTIVGSGVIWGTFGADVILGSESGDTIFGLGGGDVICGGDGNDTVYAAGGSDVVFGEAGNDHIYGGFGSDTQSGGEGNDKLYGSFGSDTISGDAGLDVIYGGTGADELSGGADDDVVYGGGGNDVIAGDSGDDSLYGNRGNDSLDGGDGIDYANDGAGRGDSCVNAETSVRCEL